MTVSGKLTIMNAGVSMIDPVCVREEMSRYLFSFRQYDEPAFQLKVRHTFHTADTAALIAEKTGCSQEDIGLAKAIGILHDIGRFSEYRDNREFNGIRYDHASEGVRILFSEGMIRRFVNDSQYDSIIRDAIAVHSLRSVPDSLEGRSRMHAAILRDADKIDNLRIRSEENIEDAIPLSVIDRDRIAASHVSYNVMASVRKRECVHLEDRKTALDYLVCVLAFVFDLNYRESRKILNERGTLARIIHRFAWENETVRKQMEEIERILEEETAHA